MSLIKSKNTWLYFDDDTVDIIPESTVAATFGNTQVRVGCGWAGGWVFGGEGVPGQNVVEHAVILVAADLCICRPRRLLWISSLQYSILHMCHRLCCLVPPTVLSLRFPASWDCKCLC